MGRRNIEKQEGHEGGRGDGQEGGEQSEKTWTGKPERGERVKGAKKEEKEDWLRRTQAARSKERLRICEFITDERVSIDGSAVLAYL